MKWPAKRISETSAKSFGMFEKGMQLARSGTDLIHLEVGCPCHDTPQHIKDATIRALQAGDVHYSDMRGQEKLRKALASKLQNFNKIEATPEEILVTNGLTHASYAAFMAAIDEGDEVILLEPYYPQHVNKIEMAGGKVVKAPLDPATGFGIRKDWVEAKITAKTRMIVLVNPANPTGRVYSRDELQALADLAIKHDLIVVSDEVYEYITYGSAEHISIASLPGMKSRTISMYAFTKAYAMDGWRLGYLTADAAMMPALMKITANDATHVNTFIQEGAWAAVTADHSHVQTMVDDDCRKRDLVCQRLNQIPGVVCPEPEGTIYAFPDIAGTGRNAQELAEEILAEAHVVVEAGSFYGKAGEGHLRVCFGAESYERIEEAMDRITKLLNK